MPVYAWRLLRASDLAYALNRDGTEFSGPNVNAMIADVGINPATVVIRQHGTNAFFYGDAGDGCGVLAFRGTLPPQDGVDGTSTFFDVVLDWLTDTNAQLVLGQGLPGRVHNGFLGSLDALWPDVEAAVKQFRPRQVLVTGHSKGGALAQMAAYRLAYPDRRLDLTVRTYAAARAGNAAFAQAYATHVPDTLRYEFQDDIVPHLPPNTGAWTGMTMAMRALHDVFPAEAPHPGHPASIMSRFETLLAEVESFDMDYASAGRLRFIDWSTPPQLEDDSLALATERHVKLAALLASFRIETIVDDHSLENGYTAGLRGAAE